MCLIKNKQTKNKTKSKDKVQTIYSMSAYVLRFSTETQSNKQEQTQGDKTLWQSLVS